VPRWLPRVSQRLASRQPLPKRLLWLRLVPLEQGALPEQLLHLCRRESRRECLWSNRAWPPEQLVSPRVVPLRPARPRGLGLLLHLRVAALLRQPPPLSAHVLSRGYPQSMACFDP